MPSVRIYKGTSLIRKRTPLGPYRRPMPRVLWGSQGGGRFPMWRSTPASPFEDCMCLRANTSESTGLVVEDSGGRAPLGRS